MTLQEIIQRAVDQTMAMGVPASQARLGQRMGVARATISLWLLGRAFPNAAHVQQLATLAGVTVEEVDEALFAAKRSLYNRRYRRLSAPRKPLARVRGRGFCLQPPRAVSGGVR